MVQRNVLRRDDKREVLSMNAQCVAGIHDYKMVYPDEDMIAAIRWKQPIEEIWECTRCGKAKAVAGTVGEVVSH